MKLFWLFGHLGLADPGNTDGYSPDAYPIADPISIVSLHQEIWPINIVRNKKMLSEQARYQESKSRG